MEHGFSLPACILGFLLHAYIEKFTILTSLYSGFLLLHHCFDIALIFQAFSRRNEAYCCRVLSIYIIEMKQESSNLSTIFVYLCFIGWLTIDLSDALIIDERLHFDYFIHSNASLILLLIDTSNCIAWYLEFCSFMYVFFCGSSLSLSCM